MTPRALALVVLTVTSMLAAGARADDAPMTAELRTWDGQTWQLTDVTVVTVHTVPPRAAEPPGDASALPGGLAAPTASKARGSRSAPTRPGGPPAASEEAKPEHAVDVRETEFVTLYRAGIAMRVDLAQVTSLVFFRTPIADSLLPSYVAATHIRHAAVAVLTDGSRIDGDYVNLGAMVVRGRAFGARISIPWTSVELVRFAR